MVEIRNKIMFDFYQDCHTSLEITFGETIFIRRFSFKLHFGQQNFGIYSFTGSTRYQYCFTYSVMNKQKITWSDLHTSQCLCSGGCGLGGATGRFWGEMKVVYLSQRAIERGEEGIKTEMYV